METYEALILGILQGITEWLPISSEGITSLVMINLFGITLKEAIFLAIWLHTGTLFAAIVFFRKEVQEILLNIVEYLRSPGRSTEISKLSLFLIISTFFSALIGVSIVILGIYEMNLPSHIATALIGILLIITGIIHLFVNKKEKSSKKIRIFDALPTGILQGFAVLPGISRSGITVSTLLFLNYDTEEAIRLSFLLSIPTVLFAEIGIAFLGKITFDMNAIIAIVSSFIVGFTTIKFFITVAERINFGYFCIFIGILSSLAFFF